MYSSIRSYRKTKSLHVRSSRFRKNDHISAMGNLRKQSFGHILIRNNQQLMTEIFSKCLKYLSLMNEIFMLINIPYNIRNPRDLDTQ